VNIYSKSDRERQLCNWFIHPPEIASFNMISKKHLDQMYSIGYDSEEPGAVLQGFTNEWRIKQAERYFAQGVNTSLTLMCDVTQSLEANAAKGSAIFQVLDSWSRTKINLRVLPLRPNSMKVCQRLCCGNWGDIVQRDGKVLQGLESFYDFPVVDGVEKRPYRRRGNNDLLPNYLHPDFQALHKKTTKIPPQCLLNSPQ